MSCKKKLRITLSIQLKEIFLSIVHGKLKENLYYEYNSASITENPFERASSSWLDEKKDFSYSTIKNNKDFFKIGHYTQMIWSSTIKVDIGAYVNKQGKVYVVARYYPAGNMIGKYPY